MRRTLSLLALAALVALSGCAALGGGTPARIGFRNATADSGLTYRAHVEQGFGNGNSGVYVTDYDGDGWPDLLTIGGRRPALFENRNGTFVRSGALPDLNTSFKSAAVIDYDGDGREDIFLFRRFGRPVVLHNEGGTFSRSQVGLGNLSYPLGAAAADYDGDGDRDLFVYQSGDWREGKPRGYQSLHAHIEDDNGYPNVLYEWDNGSYHRVTDAGIRGDRWSLAASFVDLTGDGRPDIHVANDYNNDTVYVNQGDGTFEQHLLGGSTARNGMASEVADVNRDGRPDVFVSNIHLDLSRGNMSAERRQRLERLFSTVIHSGRTRGNTLLINQGNGTFVDRAPEYGVRRGGWAWAASLADLNNDGRRDLIHATQYVVRIDQENPTITYPMVYRRNDSGFQRLDASERGFNESDGRGMATLDYDQDGDQDVVIATYSGRFRLYENTVSHAPHRLQLRVVDDHNATALGATVTVRGGGETHHVRIHGRTDYLSQDSRVAHVGLGSTGSVDLTVTWPDGTTRTFRDVPADQRVRITPHGLVTVREFPTG
ncbi:MAG: CRTAC1 family protein [Haloarculaceae archaeon]